MYIKSDEFVDICLRNNCDVQDILTEIRKSHPDYSVRPGAVQDRINSYRQRGLLPLTSGNQIDPATTLKRVSTTYDGTGAIKRQTIHTEVPKQHFLEAYAQAITEIAESCITPLPLVSSPSQCTEDLATLYISNDVHFGALHWGEETDGDWDTDIATKTLKAAYDHLFTSSPNSKVGIVCDLGDLLEADDFKNMTPKSGNILSVDSRYPKILRAAYESLIYAVNKALEKHETVYFYNIAGE